MVRRVIRFVVQLLLPHTQIEDYKLTLSMMTQVSVYRLSGSAEIHVCILGVSEEPLLPSPTTPLESAGVAEGKKNVLYFFM